MLIQGDFNSVGANVYVLSIFDVCHLALDKEILAVAADQGFREERSKVDHDLSQQWAHCAKSHLEAYFVENIISLFFVFFIITSNFCVSMASLLGVGTGKGRSLTKGLMSSSSGRGFEEPEPTLWKLLDDWRTAMSPWREERIKAKQSYSFIFISSPFLLS